MEQGFLKQSYRQAVSQDGPASVQLLRQQMEFDDLQNELAGRENNGKAARFFVDGEHTPGSKAQREKEARNSVTLTALQLAMQDRAYAAAYQNFWDAYGRAQVALDDAILENADDLEALEANAARLDDGTIIFIRPDGSAETKDGRIISASGLTGLNIPENATTAAEYREAMRRAAELARIQTEILDPAAERASDQDRPAELDELIEMTRAMEQAEQAIERAGTPTVDQPTAPSASGALLSLEELGPPSR